MRLLIKKNEIFYIFYNKMYLKSVFILYIFIIELK